MDNELNIFNIVPDSGSNTQFLTLYYPRFKETVARKFKIKKNGSITRQYA